MERIIKIFLSIGLVVVGLTAPAYTGELADRAASGKTIRLGFASEPPQAYPGEGSKPLGYVNAIAEGVLRSMGYTNIEPVVTDWGGLIPGLQAGRLDLITGGMYINKKRCDNITFSEPVSKETDVFMVKSGNPEQITTYKDLVTKNATMVTGAGYAGIEIAKKLGVPASQIMEVPGGTEILAAVIAGRAAAGVTSYTVVQDIAKKSGGKVEATNPALMPEESSAWIGIGFRNSDKDFVAKFNTELKRYLGTPEMMKAAAEDGYDEKALPGDTTTEWVCAHR
ncbi:MAG: transporter substrate-binding domain-containing protein [Mesorhizobium sp.]|nr:MAG: transporter substrate-binding domain-containing protein [Mesorhizobium sp.]TIX84554.1 MAG: transporter substrate-binding domain-containing protein [Mesorhizobium sp.]